MEVNENAISVIICCYNSASRLPETINHLIRQKVGSGLAWELLIIDNASNDNTKHIAASILDGASQKIDYRIIDQPEKGLAKAREKGIESSKYPILIFCDDDNHFQDDYLETAAKLMREMPGTGILGGFSKPKLAYYPGKWIEDMYPAMAISPANSKDAFTNEVFGAGIVIRKKIFKELEHKKIKFLLSDRTGNIQSSGGDSEWCLLAKFLGYKIYFSSALSFHHYMQEHRLNKSFFFKGHGDVYSGSYLWILAKVINAGKADKRRNLYNAYYRQKLKLILYFLPRILLGRHKFYSSINLYHHVRTLAWLTFKRKEFYRLHERIVNNLGL
jgi:glycosyltransferase involved in cell wall biosynthesis